MVTGSRQRAADLPPASAPRDRRPPVLRPGLRIFARPEGDNGTQRLVDAVNEFLLKVPLDNLLKHEVIVDSGLVVAVSILYSYTPRDQRDERY